MSRKDSNYQSMQRNGNNYYPYAYPYNTPCRLTRSLEQQIADSNHSILPKPPIERIELPLPKIQLAKP